MRSRRVRVPFVSQMQAADCGAACLAAVARSYGFSLSMRGARELCNVGRDGARAGDIVRAARACGFDADGIRAHLAGVDPSLLPVIAHLSNEHYVVVGRLTRRWVSVMDPALGRRRIPRREFRRLFSGVLLHIRPGDRFQPSAGRRGFALPRVLATYRRLFRVLGRKVGGAAAATAVVQVSALLTPLVVANAAAARGLSLRSVLEIASASAVAFAAFTAVRGRLILSIKLAHDEKVTSDLVGHLVGLDLAYFHTRSTADLLSRLTSTASVRDALSAVAVTSVVDAAAAAVFLTVLVVVNPAVGLLALAVSAVLLTTPVLAYRWTRVHALTQLEKRSVGGAKLITLLLGIEQAKAHAAERALVTDWQGVYGEELAAIRRAGVIDNRAQTIAGTCRLLAAPALVLLAQATTGSPVQAIGFGLSAAAFLGPIGNLTATVTGLIATYAHLMRIEDILDEPAEIVGDAQPRSREPVTIHLDDVSYGYPGAARQSVAGVTLTIPAGQTVVVTGESGCGKSTLARLIAGLLQPTAGHVGFLDPKGTVVVPVLGYVAQTIALYPGTVATNITFGRTAAPDDVRAAVAAARLHEFVDSLRMGLDTPVLDSGQAFSGGQRQRIAIARALLGAPPVVIFDEATSNLDALSEDHVLDALSRMDCTKILVAHGPKALRYADVVVHMHDGRVVSVERCGVPGTTAGNGSARDPRGDALGRLTAAVDNREPTGALRPV
jgi:ABC-type bacteriocin/lantibiotic exporter with double-glycine peptidase domain